MLTGSSMGIFPGRSWKNWEGLKRMGGTRHGEDGSINWETRLESLSVKRWDFRDFMVNVGWRAKKIQVDVV